MVKKWILAIWMLGCISPAFAQIGGRAVKAGAEALHGGTVANAVSRQAVNQAVKRATAGSLVRPVRISNLPLSASAKNIRLGMTAAENAPSPSVRLMDVAQLHATLLPQKEQMFVPQTLLQEEPAVYRGLTLTNLSSLQNILTRGLNANYGFYEGQIFTTTSLRLALNYAMPSKYDAAAAKKSNIPVVIKIRLTPELTEKIPSGTMGLSRIFYRNVPSYDLTDVMVFLEVNGKAGWYKTEWKNEQIVFSPVPSTRVGVDEDFSPIPLETTPAGLEDTRTALRITPDETPFNAPGANLRVLPDEELRMAVSSDEEMRLFVPENFVQADDILYRGLRLNNTAELKNLLARGMEIGKTHHERIYVSPNISVAMGYMFPHQTARLLGTAKDEMLPVLVKIPANERLLAQIPSQVPQEEIGGQRVLYNDVLANEIADIMVFIQEADKAPGWYKAALENGEVVLTPVASKTIAGWLSE